MEQNEYPSTATIFIKWCTETSKKICMIMLLLYPALMICSVISFCLWTIYPILRFSKRTIWWSFKWWCIVLLIDGYRPEAWRCYRLISSWRTLIWWACEHKTITIQQIYTTNYDTVLWTWQKTILISQNIQSNITITLAKQKQTSKMNGMIN